LPRRGGETRAVDAARQAIESPLLEVSIDGARGVLFNVIGGSDMSMHEINEAAETITCAADPEANIIFGATIDPEIEGEVIVTVVATGFDDAYFTNRTTVDMPNLDITESSVVGATPEKKPTKRDSDAPVEDIDMELDKPKVNPLKDFTKDEPVPNIWSADHIAKDDDNSSSTVPTASTPTSSSSSSEEEDELDKPSFLRRLKGARKHKDDSK